MSKHLPSQPVAHAFDYFVDMIGQLADQARDIGEVEVALHLEAIALARQKSLESLEADSGLPGPHRPVRLAERQRTA